MEKAKLINIRKNEKGKILGYIQFQNGKQMSIPTGAIIDESLNNTECMVERKNGIVSSITVNDRVIFPQKASHPSNEKKKTEMNKQKKPSTKAKDKSMAHAPYNFIPLNDTVVPGQDLPNYDVYHSESGSSRGEDNYSGRYNGYIECQLETATPLYIRDTYTKEEVIKKEENNQDNSDFFSPGGAVRIPGSSLRGMIRTLVEIMSWGKFDIFDKDSRLFYRATGDTSSLGNEYRRVMLDAQNGYFPKIKAGMIKKINNRYIIYPSKLIEGTQIYRVNFDPKTREVARGGIYLQEFEFKKIFFKPVKPKLHTHYRFERKAQKNIPYELKYALVTEISKYKKDGYIEGLLVSSGNLGTKKHMNWIINIPDNEKIDVTEFFEQYLMDENRNEKADLSKMMEDNLDGVPCFYVNTDSGKIALGHTGMFRLPYKYTINDHIPDKLKEKNLDMVESIFGDKQNFASRVFFEDAILDPGQNNIFISDKASIPQILSGPKPTTFQHYLEQDKYDDIKKLNHWDTKDKQIRGHKLYWHRHGDNWEHKGTRDEQEKFKKVLTKIKPIKPGLKFTFRLRFENLSKEELGAIIFTLDLPQECYHKLGMGKPLGLGTVKIKPQLFVTNRRERYMQLFQDDGWNTSAKKIDMQKFENDFERYILSFLKTDSNKLSSIWDHDRMIHLKKMLNWRNTKVKGWHEATQYMRPEEFRNRNVLPRPTEVYDKLSNKP